MSQAGRRRRLSRVVALAVLTAIPFLGGVLVAGPAADAVPEKISRRARTGIPLAPTQTQGLAVTGTTTYTLDVAASVIHVRLETTITNTSPPTATGYYYLDEFGVGALGPVTNARAHRGGSSLTTTVEDIGDGWASVVVDLSPNLTYGSPQDLVIEYDLPGQNNGSKSPNRVNDAFASWFVVLTGDDGAGHVVLDVPKRFALEAGTTVDGNRATDGDRTTLEFRGMNELDGFFGVSARDDKRLISRSTHVADDSFVVRAWPGDREWADFTIDAVERGIPELVDFIGLEVDNEREFEIIETATPYIYGYAGWYDRLGDLIEIGDDRNLHVIIHELSHIWFHDGLFQNRWLLEGLAEVAANHVATALGAEAKPPAEIDRTAAGAVALTRWEDVPVIEGGAEAETYGYATSYAVMDKIVTAIGDDTLRTVLARADANEIPLTGDPEPERFSAVTDWRYFFDLVALETNPAPVRELLTQYALTKDEAKLFKARRDAMAVYKELEAAADGWSPPFAVRRNLANWNFGQAKSAMDTAQDILALRAELETILEPLEGASLHGLEKAYETAERPHVLTEIADGRETYLDAAGSLVDVESRVENANPVAQLGLWGRTDDDLDAAAEALGNGHFDEVDSRVASVGDALDGAVKMAAVRTVPAVGIIGLWAMLAVYVRRRRAHRRAEADDSAGELADGVYDEPGEATYDRPVDPDELEVAAEQ